VKAEGSPREMAVKKQKRTSTGAHQGNSTGMEDRGGSPGVQGGGRVDATHKKGGHIVGRFNFYKQEEGWPQESGLARGGTERRQG